MHRPFDTPPAVEDLITVTVSDLGPDAVLCVVGGDVDAATGGHLQHTLTEAVRCAPAHLVIDLTRVEFMASIGLHILAEMHKVQRTAGRHLAVVVGHNYAVIRPMQVTGLDYCLDLHTDLTRAVSEPHSPVAARPDAGALAG